MVVKVRVRYCEGAFRKRVVVVVLIMCVKEMTRKGCGYGEKGQVLAMGYGSYRV